jgi:hypothetical protein
MDDDGRLSSRTRGGMGTSVPRCLKPQYGRVGSRTEQYSGGIDRQFGLIAWHRNVEREEGPFDVRSR